MVQIQEINTPIASYQERDDDKDYNRYIQKTLVGIDETIIKKVLHFTNEDLYLIYTTETFREAMLRWQMKNKQRNT